MLPSNWPAIRARKIAQNQRDNGGRCEAQLYGCLGIATDVHHIVARVDGGSDNDSNLAAICGACHERYTTATVQQRAQIRQEQKRQAKRKNHPGRKDRYAP